MLTVKGFVFSPFEENTYVLYDEEGNCCIVDPGCYSVNERNELKDFISSSQLRPKYLLNTHCHLDHVFGNKFVHDTYGLLPHLHPDEKQVLDFASLAAGRYGVSFDQYNGDLVYITEKDVIRLGNDELKIVLAPGHSPGHVCFYYEKGKFLMGGDVLFRGSIGRYDLPGGDLETLLTSIRQQLFMLPPDTTVYPGHGPETTIGHEMKHNPYVAVAKQ